MRRGDRILITGRNGAGKTTLLNALAGAGTRTLPQTSDGLRTDHPGAGLLPLAGAGVRRRRRTAAGRAPVRPGQWDATLRSLSAGELRRLLLAVMVNSPARILLLDEPTNFLDFDALDVVEEALRRVPGDAADGHPRPVLRRRGRVHPALACRGRQRRAELRSCRGVPGSPPRCRSRVGGAAELTEAWLANRRLSEHTRAAYRRDVAGWLAWCAARDLDPLAATFLDVNAYARGLESSELAPATVARKLSGLSSWYDFLVKLRAVDGEPGRRRGPPARVPRPLRHRRADPGGGRRAARRGRGGAGPAAARHRAVLALLADLGLRVGELVSLDVADVGWERGHRSVRFVGKGGKPRRRALTPAAADAAGRLPGGPAPRARCPLDGHRCGAHRPARGVPAGAPPGAGGRHRRLGAAVAALAAARVRHHRPRRGGAAGGRAGRDGPRRPADHPPLRPRPAQPRP